MARKDESKPPPILRAGGFAAVFLGSALSLIGMSQSDSPGFAAGLTVLAAGIVSLAIHYTRKGN